MAKRLSLAHFASRANEAAFWEAWVGAVLSRCGLYTVHHPFTLASNIGQIHEYAHTWDLDVSTVHPAEWEYLPPTETEVKSLNLSFTGPEDYPHASVLVCSYASHKRKWKNAMKVLRPFLLVSRVTGSVVYVPVGTKLKVVDVRDNDRGEEYAAVSCRKEDLRGLKDYVQTFGI